MKKLHCIFLCAFLLLMLTLLPAEARAETFISEGWGQDGSEVSFSIDSNGTMRIFGTGAMRDQDPYDLGSFVEYVEYNFGPVTSVIIEEGITYIGNQTFYGAQNLKSVTLPNSLTKLGFQVFCNCPKLTSIKFGTGLQETGIEVFLDCDSLVSVTLANANVNYGNAFFAGCDNLKTVSIPSAQTSISGSMFEDCRSLSSISMPNTLKSIGGGAFEYCTSLQSITIPGSVTEIGDSAFRGCSSLTGITIPGSVKNVGSEVFHSCSGLTSVTLSEGIQELGSRVFEACHKLNSVTIPASVAKMRSTFFNAASVKTIRFLGQAPYIEGNLFDGITATVHYPSNFPTWTADVRQNYGGTITWVGYTSASAPREIMISGTTGDNIHWELRYDGTLTISGTGPMTGDRPWLGYKNKITSVVIGEGITSIQYNAFMELKNMKKVSIADTVQIINERSFYMCQALEEVTIPSGVTNISIMTFYGCSSLHTVRFEGAVPPTFGNNCFYDVTADVYYPGNMKDWTEDVLQNYGGKLTWIPYHMCDYSESEAVYDSVNRNHSYTCSDCGNTLTENCAFSKDTVTEATRDEYGIYEYSCSICGGTYREEYAYRLSGKGRCETALAAAAELKSILNKDRFETVIIASGTNFADALAGSYLAAKKEAPILLYTSGYAATLASYISENLEEDGTVYILGGTAAVSADMEAALNFCTVTRLSGRDRFATNLSILAEAGVTNEEILVCTAYNFADSLSASAVGLPILLVGDQLKESQTTFLSELNGTSLCIIGGDAAVSQEIEEALSSYGNVQRIYGKNRSETSIAVANRYFTSPDYAVLAYSKNFPDGLCGGPLAYALGAPMLLVTPNMESVTAAYVTANSVEKALVLGGTAALTDNSVRTVLSLD